MGESITHQPSLDVVLREVIGIKERGNYYELSLDAFDEGVLIPRSREDIIKSIKVRDKISDGDKVLIIYEDHRLKMFYGPIDREKVYLL